MNSSTNRKTLFATFALIFFICPAALALTAGEIIEKSDKALRGDTQISIIEMTIKTRRWTRAMQITTYMDSAGKKTFAEINAPKKDAGNRFLLLDKQMWHYVPKLQQVIKISPSMMLQSWMGSDFTNDDVVKESSIVTDYTHRLLGEETLDGYGCYKLELIPKPEAVVVWGKIIYFARTDDCLPVRAEFYSEHDVLKKYLTYQNFRFMHDRIIPTRYKMQTVKTEDRYTLMEIMDITFNENIPDMIFTLQNLKRR